MDFLIYVFFVVAGYLGWLILFSDSFPISLNPRGSSRVGGIAQILLIVFSFFVLSQTTIFAASPKAEIPSELSHHMALPVQDLNRTFNLLELSLKFLKLLLFEEIPRIGLYFLALYASIRVLSNNIAIFASLALSSICFALMHKFDLYLHIDTAFVGAALTLIGLKYGVLISTLLHVALNHFKIGLIFPGLTDGASIFLGMAFNTIWLYVLWRYLFWSGIRKAD